MVLAGTLPWIVLGIFYIDDIVFFMSSWLNRDGVAN